MLGLLFIFHNLLLLLLVSPISCACTISLLPPHINILIRGLAKRTLKMDEVNKIKELKELVGENKYRVWWIPQVPMQPFYYPVDSIEEGVLLLKALAQYDIFQIENRVKPDCCNVGGLHMFDDEDNEWIDFYDDDGMGIEEYIK